MQRVVLEREDLPAGCEVDLAGIPLPERVKLLTGATSWTLHPMPAVGLRSITMSDGPIGVRGIDDGLGHSAQLPNPSAVAATWDRDLIGRLGALVAAEARRKGAHVVLAPVVNLQRTPVGGRHFECYSEDPFLTGWVAAAYIQAVQAFGVGACVKHFVGNESETERTTYLARIDERTLREVYLAPFERAVKDAGVWSVMAAYNRVDDGVQSAPATEHANLINAVLKGEWGFDGVVVSDWLAANSTVSTALGGLDLVMPGPGGPWEQHLLEAVDSGEVSATEIDDKVRRLITLGSRVGALGPEKERTASSAATDDLPSNAGTRALLREAVARSVVVLRNEGDLLPLAAAGVGRVALIGPAAVEPFVQGGGSASVSAPYLSTPTDALRNALPDAAITVHRGGASRRHAPVIEPELVSTPAGLAGYELTLLDTDGEPLAPALVVNASEDWNRQSPGYAHSARVRAVVRLTTPGTHRLEVGLSGAHKVRFDDEIVSQSENRVGADVILDSSANQPDGPARQYVVEPGQDVCVRIDAELQAVDAAAYGGFVRFQLRHDPQESDLDCEIAEAVAAATDADVAIVLVGTNEETESEGWDRQTLALPGRQDELVRRVAAANPRTVVVINAGAPVILPWLDDVAATVWWWLPGQEAGNGLMDALFGVIEPGGRLPWTLPGRADDVPVPNAVPVDGFVEYTEGLDVGYRGWDRLERTPARPFGFGLGYTEFDYLQLSVDPAPGGAGVRATVTIANRGPRDGREIVQIYVEPPTGKLPRPLRWLSGFASVDVGADATATITIDLETRSFQAWDPVTRSWVTPPGRYQILAARSSRDIRLVDSIDIALLPPVTGRTSAIPSQHSIDFPRDTVPDAHHP